MQFKPQKGKAFDKLPKKTLETFNDTKYLVSKKYDGNQIFIVKRGPTARWFTSDWKEFNLPLLGEAIANIVFDFTIVAEMNYGKYGKLGDRTIVQGKITTERVNFAKGLKCSLDETKVFIKGFDFLMVGKDDLNITSVYENRMRSFRNIMHLLPRQIRVVDQQLMTGKQARENLKVLVNDGWEGYMLMEPNQTYHAGKRVNHCIKLKQRPTADLRCTSVEEGKGKYEGLIGSLTLQDSQGRLVKVGSGLSDIERNGKASDFVGKVIEIEYEQILDTYIQPTFVCIREEKEID